MHRREPETKSSRAPGSRKSWTQLVKWRANVAHPSKLETSSVYLHPSWKFQNAQPNTAEWLAVSRTTNLALPSRAFTKEGTLARGRGSYLLRATREGDARNHRVIDGIRTAPRRNDSRTERKWRTIEPWREEYPAGYLYPLAFRCLLPPLFLPYTFGSESRGVLTRRDPRGNSFSLYICKWNIGRSFVRDPDDPPFHSFKSPYHQIQMYHRTDFLMCPIAETRAHFNVR